MSRLGNLLARIGTYALDVRAGEVGRYSAARKTTENMTLPIEMLRDMQLRRLASIVDHAYENCRWYKERFGAVGFKPGDIKDFADLRKLPVLTKVDIRDNIEELLASSVPEDQRRFSRSGGTTGTPMDFCRSAASQVYRRGIDLAIQRYYGWRSGEWYGALWGAASDLTLNPSIKQKIRARLVDHMYSVNSWRLTDDSYEEFVALTKKYRPTFVSAYPSIAYDLAVRIEQGLVTGVRVPVISVTAEPFYDYQREKIESVLADNAYARYGAREFGTVAFECPEKNGLHIIMESVYIESMADQSLDGDVGKILVTDLINEAMPLIRYQVGDLGALDEGTTVCPCGLQSQRISNIKGRETDILKRPDGSGIAGFNMVNLVAASGINTRVQFVQKTLDKIIIRVEGNLDDHSDSIKKVIGLLNEQIGTDLSYTVEAVGEIERTSSGKYRYVVSELSKPAGASGQESR